MTTTLPGRRDPRFFVASDDASVELVDPGAGTVRGSLRQISVSGLSFVVNVAGFEPKPGMTLRDVQISAGDCVMRGQVVVRNTRSTEGSEIEVGGLFYPASTRDIQSLMALLTGIDGTVD